MIKFKTEKITERITRIYGVCGELMYLVEGDRISVLIDTGSGFGSLKAAVGELTDKPIIVLLTHGHVDHAMGAAEFDTVYMNRQDDYIFLPHGDKEFRLARLTGQAKEDFREKEDYIPTAAVHTFLALKGGDTFDLGGEVIEIYDIPGHTKGSAAMLLKAAGILLTGDACNSYTFMFQDYSLSICEYEENLRKLKKATDGKYDRVLSSHSDGWLPAGIIAEVIEVCEEITAGRADNMPLKFGESGGFAAKAIDPVSNRRLDGGVGNIIYNKDRINRPVGG